MITPTTKAYLFWGMYESAEIRFLQRYLRPDKDVLEIGDSIGVVGCHIRKRLDPARRLVAVEADPRLMGIAKGTFALNGLSDKVEFINAAVTDQSESGFAMFETGESNVAGRVRTTEREDTVRVPSIRLSELLREKQLLDYSLVCDIEGAESSFICSDRGILDGCSQILIELHETGYKDVAVSIAQLRDRLIGVHGFSLRDSYGGVHVFER